MLDLNAARFNGFFDVVVLNFIEAQFSVFFYVVVLNFIEARFNGFRCGSARFY